MIERMWVSRHGTGEEDESLQALAITVRQRELTGNIVVFWNLKAHPSCLTSLSKATPPNPFQRVPSTGDQLFKFMNLWEPFLFKTTISMNLDKDIKYYLLILVKYIFMLLLFWSCEVLHRFWCLVLINMIPCGSMPQLLTLTVDREFNSPQRERTSYLYRVFYMLSLTSKFVLKVSEIIFLN